MSRFAVEQLDYTPEKLTLGSLATPMPRIKCKKEDFINKYKTEICKYFQAGNCRYGKDCAFAHGKDEMKQKQNIPANYRTKKCKQFFDEGFCMYGPRCQFSHTELVQPRTRECTPPSTDTDKRWRRLPVFIRLERD